MLKRFSSLKTLGLAELRRQPMQANYLYLNSIQKSYFSTSNEDKKDKKPLPVKKERKKESFKKRLFDKNKERLKHLLKEFVHLVVHGSKSAFKDSKYALSVISSKPKASYTIEEIRELSRIKKDLTKFVPFYAAVLIPGGELALPPYLFLFPRAMPSYFRTEASFKDERYKYIDNQARAYKVLRQYLLSAMIKTGYDPSTKDPEGVNKYFEENYQRILPLLDFSKMDSETLKCSSDFLMFEYVEGTYVLNLLYKTIVNFPRYMINAAMWIGRQNYRAVWTHPFFTTTFKMNFFPFEFFKKYFIYFQLRRQLQVVKHQNYSIILNQFGSLKEETVLDVARERGYYADKEEEARKWLKEDYTKVVKQHIENDQYLFWYSVILYEHHS